MQRIITNAKFKLGTVVATRGVMEHLNDEARILFGFIARHAIGDWGEACEEDKKLNDEALKNGSRLMSVYSLKTGKKIWIITEADRSVTTILFPEEY